MNLETFHYQWTEKTRHTTDLIEYTDNIEINRALSKVFSYYHRSLDAAAQHQRKHPPLHIYASCLSDNFAHGILIKARELGIIPKFSKKNAEKYCVKERCSYVEKEA